MSAQPTSPQKNSEKLHLLLAAQLQAAKKVRWLVSPPFPAGGGPVAPLP
jgi:hypothetical protein